ncbi:LuxR C-terminal-related transcriptional regulator [Sporocytophaga myxococcoides]|uniref:LuxR C-terminal-related transcriptional regulator n=1 Tax=Sporocytophaga myxococcoides TaxID=153721 RepID=UPI00040E7974|nr:LuxR C-terminal-related transcriptional regulator [Sporocytophaga myxococcoides]
MRKFKNGSANFYTIFLDSVEKIIPEYCHKDSSNDKKFALLENEQFQGLLRHSPAIIGIYNNVQNNYIFMSDNIETITGHSPEHYMGPKGMEYAISTLPSEHAAIYTQQIFPTIFQYFQSQVACKDIKRFRFTGTFQLIRKDGSVIWCMQQLNVIETDDQELPLLTMLIMSDITCVKKDNAVDFVVARRNDQDLFQNVYAATFPSPNKTISFTKRELEILQLLSKGKSSYDVAALLSISEHTVFNHRKNMLEKSEKKNTAELISFAINRGFIQ